MVSTTNASSLNEIVVIGYGTTRKKDLTGAVTVVDEKDFQKGTITTPEQMIAGKVAGVSVISNSGQPGSGSTIRFRGGSSLNASNGPLIVLDGVPLNSDPVPGTTSAIPGAGSPLSFINPSDIESFTVLKDALAYRHLWRPAAGGVIIITTKKGRRGTKINLHSNNSMSKLIKEVPVLTPAQFRSVVTANGTPAQIASMGGANTNWQDQIYQSAFGTDKFVSLTGGIKALPYRLSIGYQAQNGIVKTDNLQRTSASLNLSPVLFDKHLKINLNVTGTIENTRFANSGAAIGGAISFDPTQPIYSKSPRFGGYWEWLDPTTATGLMALVGRNPLGLLEQHYNTATPQRSIGNIQLDYSLHFLPDLHVNVNAGYDYANGKGKTFVPDSAAESYVAGGVQSGQNTPYKSTISNTLFEAYLSYTKDLKSIKSHIDVRAGYSYNNYLTTQYNYSKYYANGTHGAPTPHRRPLLHRMNIPCSPISAGPSTASRTNTF